MFLAIFIAGSYDNDTLQNLDLRIMIYKKNLSKITFLWKLGTLSSTMTGTHLPPQNWDFKYGSR